MTYLRLKLFLCLSVCLLFLCGPFLLDIAPGGKAYASGSGSKRGNKDSHFAAKNKARPENFGYKFRQRNPDGKPGKENPPAPVPEPATLLLFGAGAVGLAAFKKRFKKK